jgi:ketosteroid isomerase-like protein
VSNATVMTNEQIARQIERSVVAADVEIFRAVYAEGAVVYHALADAEMSVAASLQFLQAVLGVTEKLWYEDVRITGTERGYVDQHYACLTLRNGTEVRIPAVMVVTVENGLVTRLDEYLEGAAAAPVSAALAAAG